MNSINNNIEFINLKKLIDIANVNYDAIYALIRRNRIESHYIKVIHGQLGQGGKQYLIHPDGLPEPYRSKYYSAIKSEDKKENKRCAVEYMSLPNSERDRISNRFWWVEQTRFLTRSETEAFLLESKVNENPNNPVPSYPTLRRWINKFEADGLIGLQSDYGKNRGLTGVSEEDLAFFWTFYGNEQHANAQVCWELTLANAFKSKRISSPDEFPSLDSFLRVLKRQKSIGIMKSKRGGKEAFRQDVNAYISRNYDNVKPNEIWVGDHRQLDVFAWAGDGKPYRPWITAWIDYKTDCWVSVYLHKDAPNSMHIKQALKWGIEQFGKPEMVYIDNGKDYRAKDFSGGRTTVKNAYKDEDVQNQMKSMLQSLEIEVNFAKAYNSQAKTIESAFKHLKALVEPVVNGYAGDDAKKRPEITAKHLKKPSSDFFMNLDTIESMLHEAVEARNLTERTGKRIHGKKPLDVMNSRESIIKVNPHELAILAMKRDKNVTVHRERITLDKHLQYGNGDWILAWSQQKVTVRRDPADMTTAWCFHPETDEFLGKATLNYHSAPAIVKTEDDKEQLQRAVHQQKKIDNAMKAIGKSDPLPTAQEMLTLFETRTALKRTGTESPAIPTHMFRSDKNGVYEAAQKQETPMKYRGF